MPHGCGSADDERRRVVHFLEIGPRFLSNLDKSDYITDKTWVSDTACTKRVFHRLDVPIDHTHAAWDRRARPYRVSKLHLPPKSGHTTQCVLKQVNSCSA